MGFIDTSNIEKLPVFYNLVHAVGRGCPNMRDDVKLIQYLLISFYEVGETIGYKKPPGELKVTGVCDQTTMNCISDFQFNLRKRSKRVALDGRIDRLRNKNGIGSISKTRYTLLFLNRGVMKYNPDAFVRTPMLIPLENPMNVPPPSNDMVNPLPQMPWTPDA
jgi:hypothetical protein